MKIVMVGPFAFYPHGTVPVRMMPIAKSIIAKGNEVKIVLPPYDNFTESGLEYQKENVPIYNIKISKVISPFKQVIMAFRIVRKVLSFHPDMIYVFKPAGYSGLSAMILIWLRWIKVLDFTIFLDSDDWEGYGGFYDYFLGKRLYPRYQLNFYRFQTGWVPKHVDAVTVASRTIQSLLWAMGISPQKVYYLPNGIYSKELLKKPESEKLALREKLGLNGKSVILLYTRFFEFDIIQVVDILKLVKQEVDGIKLLVVGKGQFGEEEDLRLMAEQAGLSKLIVFAGWIQPDKIPLYLDLGDIAIYPFNDNLLNRTKCPGKLIELMNMGIPIVANKVGQITEYIEHGHSGILTQPGDNADFADNIIRLLQDQSLRKQIGENARSRIRKEFSWDQLTAEVGMMFDTVKTKRT